ncbi:MAG: hypothetical protein HKL95_11450, partial [Phycisphaerae bacterium]|nr:hypothetical protein [Phycisphaerae bacterium]
VLAGPVEAAALEKDLAQAMATGQIASLDAGRRLVGKTAQVRTYRPRST